MQWLPTVSLRQAARGLRRNPTFATAALLTFALGIGANIAVFSVVNGVLLNPLPYPDPASLISVVTTAPGAPGPAGAGGGIPNLPESASMYVTYADHNRSFQNLGVWFANALTVTGFPEPERVRAVAAAGVIETLRVKPLLGRAFTEEDYRVGSPETVILGWGYWQRRFAGDPSVIGRTLTIESRPHRVIGVMPRGFRVVSVDAELVVPLRIDRGSLFLVPFAFETVARLRPGVTIEQAEADLRRLASIWGESWPMPPGFGAARRPFDSWRISPTVRPLKNDLVGSVANVLWIVMSTIGVVMVIACANVTGLILVRAEGRRQEYAVRTALGARWRRLLGESLIESVMLAVVGGALGTGGAYVGVRLLTAFGPATLPRLEEISIDLRVLAFALLLSLLSGVVFGLVPALKYARGRIQGLVASSRAASDSRERHRTRNSLVVAQVALALVLLVSAGLMIRTFLAMRAVAPGFATQNLQTVRIAIPTSVAATAEPVAQIHRKLLDALGSIPGVTAAALTSAMPMEGILPNPLLSSRSPLVSERDAPAVAQTRGLRWFKSVSPGFFRASGTQVVAGREYTWSDLDALRPAVIVSRNLAIELWGSPAAALGQRVRSGPNGSWREVIGVVEDVRENGVQAPPPPIVYWPSRLAVEQPPGVDAPRAVVLVVRSPLAGSQALIDAIRQRVSSVDVNLPLSLVRTMQDVYDASMERTSFALVMLGIAAFMALVLGLVGIYGVVAYAVARRTREVGIRMALGARQRELRRMFLRHAFVLTGVGVAIGLGAAAALTRVMTSLLFDVRPVDPLTYVAVALLLLAATLLASYVPARRASGVDPAVALRAE